MLPQPVAASLCRERTRWHSCPKNDSFHLPTGTRVGRVMSIYECGHLGTLLDEGDLHLIQQAASDPGSIPWHPDAAIGSMRRCVCSMKTCAAVTTVGVISVTVVVAALVELTATARIAVAAVLVLPIRTPVQEYQRTLFWPSLPIAGGYDSRILHPQPAGP